MVACAHRRSGFTLLELVLVIAIVGIILSLALPKFLPAIASSNLEGAARHLANYGRAAITQAAFGHERYTFRCDLATGQYWLVRWKEVATTKEKEEKSTLFKKDSLFERGDGTKSTGLFNRDRATSLFGQSPGLESVITAGAPDDFEEKSLEMQERFDQFSRLALMSRARNVKHEGILGEIGPLFEKEFTLQTDKQQEEQYEEVKETLLSRTWLPQGVVFESADVGAANRGKGVVEVEITPLGLAEPVTFYLRGEDGSYYTVAWDAITGGARIYPGKQAVE